MREHVLLLDGATGTSLQAAGLRPGERGEDWNLSHPKVVSDIHRRFFDAGCHVVYANTFGANSLHYDPQALENVIAAALANARAAREQSIAPQPKWVALSLGPTGRMLKPFGDLDFEDAVACFAETVRLAVRHGADLIAVETMNDCYETKAALLAAKENSDLPVFVTNAYGTDGKLLTGASPAAMIAMLEGMGADAVGVNCSYGPQALRPVIEEYLQYASVPVILKPNAGLPTVADGKTVYELGPVAFAEEVSAMVRAGVRICGGCCGTTPEHLSALAAALPDAPLLLCDKSYTVVSSYTHAVFFGDDPILIGERINPTGKKRMKAALLEHDVGYLLNMAVRQEEKGVHILDVNVGLPELDEPAVLEETVRELQAVTALPLQLDTADPRAMERALRRYNGKALVNSVNGTKKSMDAIFPLLKKYGGTAVALTLDEDGIPATAEGRFAIAQKILREAASYGIDKKNLIFDTLTITVSAEPNAAKATLEALRRIREELGCHTVLGISNVSFGLPHRDVLNGVFFALALEAGLSAAIVNPESAEIMKSYSAYRALTGRDAQFADYLALAAEQQPAQPEDAPAAGEIDLKRSIVKGFQTEAAACTEALLRSTEALTIIDREIIPALNTVGEGFERKTVYLPQLLMSAEAASAAFEVIKKAAAGKGAAAEKGPVVLATVQGDIHDIGKNIVRLLLENFGFAVVDLGRDVAPERIAEATGRLHAPLVGLSALMTTTVPAMEETIRLLRREAPWCRIVVGGAVLTEQYAAAIGADKYARDAMETVRYAEQIIDG